ncbi:MAG: dicarboxylate/amino acid:cation symporter [Synergistaceae bacterium]|nr:dicarboxylate/amino acid:cation symporter [Synergistaceae bacterium]
MQRKFKADTDKENAVKEALQYINEILPRMNMTQKEQSRTELMCEESLMRLMEHSDFSRASHIAVRVRKSFGNVSIILSVPGNEFDFYGVVEDDMREKFSPYDNDYGASNILLRMFLPDLRYRHSGTFNVIAIKAVRSSYSLLLQTLWALAFAITAGLILRMSLPENYLTALNDDVLMLVYEIFLDAMKMCTLPIVLLSIMLCTADIHGFSGLAEIGKRLAGSFVFTQIFAVITGFVLVMIFGAGTGLNMYAFQGEASVNATLFTVAGMLKDIIPDNVLKPIVDNNALQLTVLGCILGIAAGLTASKRVLEIVDELSNIFMKVTEMFMNLMPLAVFCSVASMIITAGTNALLSVLGMFLAAMLGFLMMNLLYCVMIRISGLNPLHMFRKSARTMITAFTTCSTSAAIPDSLNACKAMEISSKLYSFAIPVGSSLNKNAFCLSLAAITLTAANMYGIRLSLTHLASLGALIIIIAPGTSWTPIIAISLLFENIGCPLNALGIIMAIYPLLDMADTVTTCNGTIASTLTTAKQLGLLDTEEYTRP